MRHASMMTDRKRTYSMIRTHRLAIVAIAAFGLAATDTRAQLATGIPEAGPPMISADQATHDFGETWFGPAVSHIFKITNTGGRPLTINKVIPACGCTVAGVHPKTIEPGATADFPFSLDTKRLHDSFNKRISIRTNDPITPTLQLYLKGSVKHYIEVEPKAAQFGKVYGGEAKERLLTLTNNTDDPMTLTLPSPASNVFDYELTETTPGQVFQLRIKTNLPHVTGEKREKLKIASNVPNQATLTINVNASMPKRIDVQPSFVNLFRRGTDPAANQAITRVLRLTNYGDKPIKVIEITSNDEDKISLTHREEKAGESFTVQVSFPPGYDPGPSGKTITLVTDDPEIRTLNIPVRLPSRRQAKKSTKRPAEEMVGKNAPAYDLTTAAGEVFSRDAQSGKVTVMNFYAPNCGFCKRQIPRMDKLRPEYEAKGVRFVNVTEKMGSKVYTPEQVSEVLDTMSYKGEYAIDPGNIVGKLYKATSFPTMMIVGKTGKIEAANIGNVGDLEKRMRGQLDALLEGKPVPGFASKPAPKKNKRPALELKGKPAPTFAALNTLDGKTISSDDFAKNKAVVLNFVAPNCGFCKRQLPKIESVRKAFESKGVRFVNLSQTMRKEFTNDEAKSIFEGVGSQLELAPDAGNKVGQMFKAVSFPTLFVVDASGKVDNVYVGAKADLDKTLTADLERLISAAAP